MKKIIGVPGIGNYYGGLCIKKLTKKFYWGIENWDDTRWCEIPEYLYEAVKTFVDERSGTYSVGDTVVSSEKEITVDELLKMALEKEQTNDLD